MKKSSIAVISIFSIVVGLLLAIGMCLTLVWRIFYLVPGILVGCAGLLSCVLNARFGW